MDYQFKNRKYCIYAVSSMQPKETDMRYLLIVFLLTSCASDFDYPNAKKEQSNYSLHGSTVIDPYKYMEDFESSYVVEWSDQQNSLVESYLADSEINNIQKILTKAYSSEYYSLGYFNPDTDYYFYNSGAEEHHLYMKKSEEDKVILDPNKWSDDQTLNLDKVSLSPNKKYLAYSVTDGGVDWRTIKIMDLETNDKLDFEITEVKFSDITWKEDSSGFYYNKYPKPLPENRLRQQSYDAAIYFADIKTGEEKLFYGQVNQEQNYTVSFIGEDKKILIKVITGSEEENFYLFGNNIEALEPITPINQASFSYVHADDEGLFFITNLDADNYRLVKVLFANFEIVEVISENDFALKAVSFVSDYLIADYIDHADMRSKIVFFDQSGKELDVTLPESISGTIGGFQSIADDSIMFSVTSYTQPIRYFSFNYTDNSFALLWEEVIPGFNPNEFSEVSTHYESKDGTMIPITYSYKTSAKLNKDTPIFLYAYGGYNISIRPSFTPKYVAWLELGGVLAVANIRGGGEFGKAWHNAGRLNTKQNTFDDFLYASKFLEDNAIGNRKSTVISGRSNGGLLVGATLIQNPNYFGAALPAVGVMDMIRFTEFTEGWGWRGDYGYPIINQEDFDRNIKISPYHQTKPGVCYSPTLTTTARRDDRVVPSHSYKFTARQQEYQACNNPVMLYDVVRAGHGSGNGVAMPKWKRIMLFSVEQSFALKNIKQ